MRTVELEEKVIWLERELEVARAETRVLNSYISNLKVYEGIANGYILRLKERLEKLDPGCRLLEYRIPGTPAEVQMKTNVDENQLALFSEVVERMF